MGRSHLKSKVKKRTVAIIQARMGSSRFPGKMLADLGGHPILKWVINRTKFSAEVDEVLLATTELSRDTPLVELANELQIKVYRGDEQDVLGRFVYAAENSKADWVVRICADNPFIDPKEIDRLIHFYKANTCDYACNHLECLGNSYVDGFGAEITSLNLLKKISAQAVEMKYREHVTLYFWDHQEKYKLLAVPAPPDLAYPELSFDVDTPEDLTKLKRLVTAGINFKSAAAQIVKTDLKLKV